MRDLEQVLVPQWAEGNPLTKEKPQYEAVAVEEIKNLPIAGPLQKEKQKRKRHSTRLPENFESKWEQYVLLPLRAGKFLFLLSLLLTIVSASVLTYLAKHGKILGDDPFGVVACLILLGMLSYQCGSWYSILWAFAAGESCSVPWDAQQMGRVLKGMAYGLICFIAGPAWLLLIAGLFWLYAGDLAPIDWFLLSELVAVAAAYWLFCLLAVAIDQHVSSANPLRVVTLVRWLGVRTSAVVACIAGGGALLHGFWVVRCLSAVHESADTWFWLLLTFISFQVWSIYLLGWLGIRCYVLRRKQRRRKVQPASPDPKAVENP